MGQELSHQRCGVKDVLKVVEDEQQPLVAQVGGERSGERDLGRLLVVPTAHQEPARWSVRSLEP